MGLKPRITPLIVINDLIIKLDDAKKRYNEIRTKQSAIRGLQVPIFKVETIGEERARLERQKEYRGFSEQLEKIRETYKWIVKEISLGFEDDFGQDATAEYLQSAITVLQYARDIIRDVIG